MPYFTRRGGASWRGRVIVFSKYVHRNSFLSCRFCFSYGLPNLFRQKCINRSYPCGRVLDAFAERGTSGNLTSQLDITSSDSEFHAYAIIRQILMKSIPNLF